MFKRVETLEGFRMRRGFLGPDVRDARGPRWSRHMLDAAEEHETPRMSLASRLTTNQSAAGRVAQWLFIKGGMVILLISGLLLLGLVGAFVGGR